jgi:acid stress-induced BolA-like protein IbaG/YrbA
MGRLNRPLGLNSPPPHCPPSPTPFPMNATEVQHLILSGLPGAEVHVRTDDDTHFEAVVVSTLFAGKRTLQRHQMVYAGLGERMGREVHALSIQAFTPDEWRAAGGAG